MFSTVHLSRAQVSLRMYFLYVLYTHTLSLKLPSKDDIYLDMLLECISETLISSLKQRKI